MIWSVGVCEVRYSLVQAANITLAAAMFKLIKCCKIWRKGGTKFMVESRKENRVERKEKNSMCKKKKGSEGGK